MQPKSNLSALGRAYIVLVICAGAAAIASSSQEVLAGSDHRWLVLAALTVISGSATVKLPSIPVSLSVSETFVFASVLLYGPAAGTLTVALDGLIISFWLSKRRKEPHRVLFNMAAPAISIWIAAQLFFALLGTAPFSVSGTPGLDTFVLPLLVFAAAYFSLNSWLIAFAVALETHCSAAAIWRSNFVWLSLNFLCGASVAAMLTLFPRGLEHVYMAAIVPLLLVLYLTYKTSMDRVADATKHLHEINDMYLSTIETLAMAVDAKDQVTHGHIRRVQTYAVGLAKRLGVRSAEQLRAIEAASLLHDMGKLAVPEYILNKPGKLTPAEFDKMKLHASIGADILSSIQFPYPVIPIVRHHHENWDGSGYPDGLAGTDIPIGARILSVVDCFDALTSDRPYRPRLSDEHALAILDERRGKMYDPMIVDEFVRVHHELGDNMRFAEESQPAAIVEIARALSEPLEPDETRRSLPELASPQMLALVDLANAASPGDASDPLALLCLALRGLVPWDLVALWAYQPTADTLIIDQAFGVSADVVLGQVCSPGERLSGWVAANRLTALNSDAALDLLPSSQSGPLLKSALATPIIADNALLGVLSLYSCRLAAFTSSHQATVEFMATYFASAMRVATGPGRENTSDRRARGDAVARMQRFVDQYRASAGTRQLSLVLVSGGLTNPGDALFRRVVAQVHAQLRLGDLVTSLSSQEAVCLLVGASQAAAESVADRVRQSVSQNLGPAAGAQVLVTAVTASGPSESVSALLLRARQQKGSRERWPLVDGLAS